jgi:hypothetical protein
MGRRRQEPVADHAGPCLVCKGSGMVSASRYGFCGPVQLPCPQCVPLGRPDTATAQGAVAARLFGKSPVSTGGEPA